MKKQDLKIEKDTIDVYKTDNYDLFKSVRGNRPVKPNRVKKILNSVEKYGWFDSSIIIIGEGMATIDGQHRLQALREYKKKHGRAPKVRYVVDNKLLKIEYIRAMNYTQNNWSYDDFLQSYADLGNENYIQYRNFLNEYKIPHSSALCLIFPEHTSGGRKHDKFKLGKMVVYNWDMPKVRAERIVEISKYFKPAKSRRFVNAMSVAWKHPNFDHKKFMGKLKTYRDMIYRAEDEWGYIKMIEDIYNYHSKDRINLRGGSVK